MATYEISDPSGQKFQVTAPDSASQDDVLKYAQSQFSQQATSAPSIGPEIAGGVVGAIKSGAGQVADYLNPFSEARRASYAKQAQAPLSEALKENLGQLTGTGAALATPLTVPGNVAGAIATPLVAHPFQALNQAAGIDLPYQKAYEQAGTALLGARPAGASPIGAKMVPATPPSQAGTKLAATSVYEDPAIRRTLIPQQDVVGVGVQAADTFIKDHKQVMGIAREMQNAKPWDTSIDKLDSWSERLGGLAKEMQMGRAGPEPTPKAAAAMSLKSKIDDLISGASPKWSIADTNYTAFKAAQAFDKKSNIAAIRAEGGTGDYAQRLRTAATQMLVNPRATRGWSADQLEMLRQISKGSPTQKALTWFSNLLGNRLKHGVGTIIGGGVGMSGGPAGAALGAATGAAADAAISGGAMAIRNALANRQTNALIQSLLSSSPLAKSLPPQIAPPPIMGGLFAAPRPPFGILSPQFPAYADQYQRP